MRFSFKFIAPVALVFVSIPQAEAGLIGYGICQTGCNTLAVSCYAAAGFVFGTVVAAAAAPPAILGCNAALGTCSAACAVVALTPTP